MVTINKWLQILTDRHKIYFYLLMNIIIGYYLDIIMIKGRIVITLLIPISIYLLNIIYYNICVYMMENVPSPSENN